MEPYVENSTKMISWQEAPSWLLNDKLNETLNTIDAAMQQAYLMPMGDALEKAIEQISILSQWCDYIVAILQSRMAGGVHYVQ